jgi:myosin heavy chain 6/7
LFAVQTELEEQISALKTSDDHAKKAAADASRLAEELRQEQEHSAQVEKARRTAEMLAKDLQTRLDEAEAAAMQGGRKIVQKMEQVGTIVLTIVAEQQFFLISCACENIAI